MHASKVKKVCRNKHHGVMVLSRQSMTFWNLSDNHRMVTYAASEGMHGLISTRYMSAKYFKGAVKAGLLAKVADDVKRYPIGYEGYRPERYVEISRHKQYILTSFGRRLVRDRFRFREPKSWEDVFECKTLIINLSRTKAKQGV